MYRLHTVPPDTTFPALKNVGNEKKNYLKRFR